MKIEERASQAARTVLTRCLDLPSEAEFVIFTDETTLKPATILAEKGVDLGLLPIPIYYTNPMQISLGSRTPPGITELLQGVAAALICLNGSPQCFSFRDNLRQIAWNAGVKVAHMPGVDLPILSMADGDYDKLTGHCEMLALALAKGEQIEILTTDRRGQVHPLKAKLDPWNRLPIISDGIIHAGAWGNVPSGETYIAPPEGLASGSLVVNGSLPGYRMVDEELILYFEHGQLVNWDPKDSPAALHLHSNQIEHAKSQGDENWSNLAEIGLGANRMVKKLTGNPLLDEKKYGSLHIALGDNTDMGGEVSSSIHCDIVCLSPEVLIDGKTILKGGKIVLDPLEWREDFTHLNPPEDWSLEQAVRISALDAQTDRHGRLKRLWHTGAGRVCSVPVGDEQSAVLAASVYNVLIKNGRPIRLGDLPNQFRQFGPSDILKLTYLLRIYGLIIPADGMPA